MKRCFLLILLAVASLASAQLDVPAKYRVAPPKPSQAVAKVGGKEILASDVEPYLWQWMGKGAMEDVISYVLITQDAGKKGVVVSDSEVEKAIDNEVASVQKNQGGSADQAADWLKGQGFPRSRLFLRLKAQLLVDKILTNQFHPENYVKVSTILVRPSTSDASAVEAAIKLAQDAYTKLKNGIKWDDVLASVTNDRKVIQSHGYLGWKELDAFPESTKKEIMALPVGAFTRPAQTKNGIQIFRVDGRGAEAKGTDLEALKTMYMAGARSEYINNLKSQMAQINLGS